MFSNQVKQGAEIAMQGIGHRQARFGRHRFTGRRNLLAGKSLVIERQGHHRPARDQLNGADLVVQRLDRVTGESVVVTPRRGMLQDNRMRPSRREQFETTRVGGVHQRALPFQDHELRLRLGPGAVDRVFDLAGYEVVDQRVEYDAVAHPLHPGGLPGADHFHRAAARFQALDDFPGRGSLTDRGIGAKQGDTHGADRLDRAREEMQFRTVRRPPHVTDLRAAGARQFAERRVFGKKVVQAGVDVQAGAQGALDHGPGEMRQAAAIGRQPDHEMRGRPAFAGSPLDRLRQRRHHGYSGGPAVQHLAGVCTGVARVDDRQQFIAPGPAHQAVSGFSVRRVEGAFAVHDGAPLGEGYGHFIFVRSG